MEDCFKKHCIVFTPESEAELEEIKKILIRLGEDRAALNKSLIVRKALRCFIESLKKQK